MASSTLAELPLRDAHNLFENMDDPCVHEFLEKDEFLYPILNDIAAKALVYFPVNRISLAVIRDPEAADRDQLAVSLHVRLSPSDALGRLSKFDREWWLANLSLAQG